MGGVEAETTSSGRGWGIAFAILLATLLIPFLVVDVPPVLDYPNHLAGFYILSHPTDPFLSRYYETRWAPLPNLGTEILAVPLMRVLPVFLVGRLVLAITMIAPIIGTAVYSRVAFGRYAWWSLGVGLVAFNGLFLLGFMNFQLGLGLALLGAALWILARRRSPVFAALVGAICSTIIYFCHLSALLFFVVLMGSYELERLFERRAWSLKDLAISSAVQLFSLAPPAYFYLTSSFASVHRDVAFQSPSQKAIQLLTPFLTYSVPLGMLTAVFVAYLMLRRPGIRAALGATTAFFGLILLYLVSPGWAKGGAFVDTRFPVMAGFLLFAGFIPRISRKFAPVAVCVVAGFLALRTLEVGLIWRAHAQRLSEFRAVVAQVPRGALVLATYGIGGDVKKEPTPPGSNIFGLHMVDLHMPALIVLERQAFWPLLFANPTQQPLAVKAPYDQLSVQLGELPDSLWLTKPKLTQYMYENAPYLVGWKKRFDYVLVLNLSARPLGDDLSSAGLDLVSKNRTALLYAIKH